MCQVLEVYDVRKLNGKNLVWLCITFWTLSVIGFRIMLIERIIIHGAFEQAYVTSNIINISTFYVYYIYTATFPTLAHGWRSIAVFWSQIFGHVRGVEANFEKIKNVITPVKIKLMTWNLVWSSFIPIWWNQYNKNLNFRYTSWVSEFSHFRRRR